MPHTATASSRPRSGAGGCPPPHPGKEKAGPEREGCKDAANEQHDKATVVSIPRDTLVQRPACQGDGSENH
ncbi:hypothetical protein ABZ598_24115, partial [Streptomyces albus]